MTDVYILELLARGAACGLSLLIGIAFLRTKNGNWAARLGGLFAFGSASFTIMASEGIREAFGPLTYVMFPFAIFNGVFFWWFATALFDDDFKWHWWRFVPFGLEAIFSFISFQSDPGSALSFGSMIAWQLILFSMMGHAAWLAIRDLGDDLIEPRRQFRVVLAVLIAMTGVGLSIAELIYIDGNFPPEALQLQAGVNLTLALAFCIWTLRARPTLFAAPSQGPSAKSNLAGRTHRIDPEDQAVTDRLSQAMADGFYKEPALSVGMLASHLKTPEHRLRKLINSSLGYRNFTSFLNSYRLEDAKSALADPDRSREQILTIALDLGFNSITPFNRAFKTETGMTPTHFRRDALSKTSKK